MENKDNLSAIIIGATGLVGSELLKQLIASEHYNNIVVLTRKTTGLSHEKMVEYLIDLNRLTEYANHIKGDHAFCCLGTTMKKAGSKENFRKVDYDYVLGFARIASANGIPGFSLISSLGASKRSLVFYSRVKGEIEEEVSMLKFDRLHIFRPSLLLGERKEKRAGEDIAKKTYGVINFLLPARYKGIEAEVVARGMLEASLKQGAGLKIIPSEEIRKLGRGLSFTT